MGSQYLLANNDTHQSSDLAAINFFFFMKYEFRSFEVLKTYPEL